MRGDRPDLTKSEAVVLSLVSRGLTQKEIGRELWVSPETVKSHLTHIRWALGARNSAHAVAIAMDRGLIQP